MAEPTCVCGHPASDHLREVGICRAGWGNHPARKKCRCAAFERRLALVPEDRKEKTDER